LNRIVKENIISINVKVKNLPQVVVEKGDKKL
jgi:hypothetical protein